MKTESPQWPAIFAKAHKILSRQHPADTSSGVVAAIVRDGTGICLMLEAPSEEAAERIHRAVNAAVPIFELGGEHTRPKKAKSSRAQRAPSAEQAPEATERDSDG